MTAASRPRNQRFWATFALPGVAWLSAFFLVPIYAVLAAAFGRTDPLLRILQPEWNPLNWDFASFNKVFGRIFSSDPLHLFLSDDLGGVFRRTFGFVLLALVGCCLIGYPVAYYVARKAHRSRGVLLAALVLPFWISYLMRMLAWVNLLQTDGYVNRFLQWTHIIHEPRNWLDGDWPTVVIGLIYGYVPFFILPLYAALERLDVRLLEAGRDLGASAFSTFLRITLPLSVPGLLAASVTTILPMCGDYYTNTYLTSGSPRTEMVGNQIEFYLRGSTQPQTGASLVLILMALLVVLMVYYLVTTIRQQRAAAR